MRTGLYTVPRCPHTLRGPPHTPATLRTSAASPDSIRPLRAGRNRAWARDMPNQPFWIGTRNLSGCGVLALTCWGALAACGGSTAVTTVAGPSGVRCETTAAAQPTTVPPDGGTIQVSVTSTRDCTWTASSEASWVQLSVTSGQGSGTLAGTVARNEHPTPRSAAIIVNDQRLAVSQEPRPCSYEVRPAHVRVGHQGGRSSVELTTLTGCAWAASSSAEWVRLAMTTGNASGTIEFEVSSNEGAARDATIVITDQRIVVDQEAGVRPLAPPVSPAPPPCRLSVSPGTQSIDGRGGEGRFRVDTPPGCRWSASPGASWLAVISAEGSGPGEVAYLVQTNPTPSERSATIAVTGSENSVTHTVRQDAATRVCTYGVSPSSQSFPAGGGEGSLYVEAQAACQWSALSGASWVVVRTTSSHYGLGSSVVAYAVLPNTSTSARSTRVTVAGQTHTVNQAGTQSLVP